MATGSDIEPDLKAKAQTVYERLLAVYGSHPLVPRREPMHELISPRSSTGSSRKASAWLPPFRFKGVTTLGWTFANRPVAFSEHRRVRKFHLQL